MLRYTVAFCANPAHNLTHVSPNIFHSSGFLLLEAGRGLGCGSWLQVYCPYVIVNASGHNLRFRAVDCRRGGVLQAEKRTEAKPVPATNLAPLALVAPGAAAASPAGGRVLGVEATAHLFAVEPDSVDDVNINSYMQLQYAGRSLRTSSTKGNEGAAASDSDFVVIGEREAASAAAAADAAGPGPWSTDVGIGAKQIVELEGSGYTLLELNVNVETGPGMFI